MFTAAAIIVAPTAAAQATDLTAGSPLLATTEGAATDTTRTAHTDTTRTAAADVNRDGRTDHRDIVDRDGGGRIG